MHAQDINTFLEIIQLIYCFSPRLFLAMQLFIEECVLCAVTSLPLCCVSVPASDGVLWPQEQGEQGQVEEGGAGHGGGGEAGVPCV